MTIPIPAGLPDEIRDRLVDVFALPAVEPDWGDSLERSAVLSQLAVGPTVTTVADVDRLNRHLHDVATGRELLLQGDCGHPFRDASAAATRADTATLWDMATLLMAGTTQPVVITGRLGGQYAFSVRGADAADSSGYRYDAHRMLAMYANASATRNLIRELRDSPPVEAIERWGARLDAYARRDDTLGRVADDIRRNVGFLTALRPGRAPRGQKVYSGHRATILEYDAALLRTHGDHLYALSADSLWLGGPAAATSGAHVAFAATVDNPISVTIGPRSTPREVAEYLRLLGDGRPPGRITFVCRMGVHMVHRVLPPIVERVQASGTVVVWVCDPTGNRDEKAAIEELTAFVQIHQELESWPGGLHVGGQIPTTGRPHLDPDRHWLLALTLVGLTQTGPLVGAIDPVTSTAIGPGEPS